MGSDGLVIDGQRYPVPGVRVVTWEDDARVPKAVHGAPRQASDVIASIVHTSRGKDARITRETGSPAKGLRVARYLGRANSRQVSAHVVVAGDGTVYQMADIAAWRCNHAGAVNGWTWGLEASQDDDDPSLTRAQVAAFVATMHVIHDALRIPKRVPMAGGVHVSGDVMTWFPAKKGGAGLRFAGAVGHRCVSASRGKGDPGDALMEALRASGFAPASTLEMTLDVAPAAPTEADEPDEMHDGDDPAWPPLPAWLDPALEVDASHDLPDDLAAFVRAQAQHLAALGVTGDRAAELLAHAATECGRGRRAHGANYFGAKIRERDDRAHREKYGRGLGWWRDFGHIESGDDEVEYYRAFESPADAWRWFVWRHVGRPDEAPSSERYAATGRAFWSDTPSRWFVDLLRAGYRGDRRAAEVRVQGDAHPSVVSHRALVSRVRGML